MLVSDIMQTEVRTVSAFATLREAMRLMREHGVRALVVEKKTPSDAYGILTYGNILRAIFAEEGDIDLINVYDVCAKPAIAVAAEMDARHAAALMVRHDFRRVLVLEGNELRGILTMNDIMAPVLRMVGE